MYSKNEICFTIERKCVLFILSSYVLFSVINIQSTMALVSQVFSKKHCYSSVYVFMLTGNEIKVTVNVLKRLEKDIITASAKCSLNVVVIVFGCYYIQKFKITI